MLTHKAIVWMEINESWYAIEAMIGEEGIYAWDKEKRSAINKKDDGCGYIRHNDL